MDFEVETFVTHALRGEGFDASEDGTGRGTPIVPIAYPTRDVSPTITRNYGKQVDSSDTSEGPNILPIAFTSKDYGNDATEDLSPTLRSMNHDGSHANGGGQVAVAFTQNQRDELRQMDIAGALAAEPGMKQQTYIAEQWAVRRLMPLECERLQGFDDGFTAIPYRKRKIAADEAEQSAIGGARVWQDETGQWFTDCMADGPRYKMIGNSMARPVIRWILSRVERQFSNRGLE